MTDVIKDIVEGVAIHRHAESLLVQDMTDKADGAPGYEEGVQGTGLYRLVDLIIGVTQATPHFDNKHTDRAIDIKDQVVFFLSRLLFDFKGKVKQACFRKVRVGM